MSNGIDIFLTDDVGEGNVDRAIRLLAGIPHGAQKAIGSAAKRAATSGKTQASKSIRQEYLIKAGDFKSHTKSKVRYISSGGGTTVDLEFRGTHIPLSHFDYRVGADGRVSARVKRSSGKKSLDSVFRATVGGHAGLFERVGAARFPIEQKMGPSAPQMMSANDDLSQEIGDKIREAFDKRIDHEIQAVLNGWRK